jgi:hypothetical protein
MFAPDLRSAHGEPAGGGAGGDDVQPPPRSSRGPMNWFIDVIELVAAGFIGIVAADIFISVMLRYFFSVQIRMPTTSAGCCSAFLIFWGSRRHELSWRPHHGGPALRQCRPAPAARHRRVRHARSLVRRHGADLHALRQGLDHARRSRAHLRPASAGLAVFLVAWLGDISAVLLIAIRTYRLIFQPDEFGAQYQIKPVE